MRRENSLGISIMLGMGYGTRISYFGHIMRREDSLGMSGHYVGLRHKNFIFWTHHAKRKYIVWECLLCWDNFIFWTHHAKRK